MSEREYHAEQRRVAMENAKYAPLAPLTLAERLRELLTGKPIFREVKPLRPSTPEETSP